MLDLLRKISVIYNLALIIFKLYFHKLIVEKLQASDIDSLKKIYLSIKKKSYMIRIKHAAFRTLWPGEGTFIQQSALLFLSKDFSVCLDLFIIILRSQINPLRLL